VRGKELKRALRRRQLLWGIAWRTPLCHGPTAMPGRRNPCAWHYFSCTDRRVVLRKSDLTEQRSSRLPSRHLLGRRSPRRPAGSRSPGELPDARTSQQKARPAPQLGVRGTPPAQCGINRSAVLGDSQSHMSLVCVAGQQVGPRHYGRGRGSNTLDEIGGTGPAISPPAPSS
jgi:hypothetical protein